VGNSRERYYFGPEVPGTFDPPLGGYKEDVDEQQVLAPRVKRQAARFRVYAYGADGRLLHEVTAAEASVTWSVHLANKKGEWDKFQGRAGEDLPVGQRRPNAARNPDVPDRASLVIDPGPRSVAGPGQSAVFDGGAFLGVDAPLGEIRTDPDGRLIVLGGFGTAATTDPTRLITNYANNDRWYDDTSDGPVTATVTFANGTTMEASPSWVIVGPPDYAPAIPNFITMYDVAYEVAVRRGWLQAPARPSFTEHIYPVLARTVSLQWINVRALVGHGPDTPTAGHFPRNLAELASNGPEAAPARQTVFRFLRDPYLVAKFRAGTATPAERATAVAQAEYRYMPSVSGDDGDARSGAPGNWLTLTRLQYDLMRKWAAGEFEADWEGPTEQVLGGLRLADNATPAVVTPEGLDRAALEAASGGSFFPGIEAGWIIRNESVYREAFRFDHGVLAAGDLTKRMAVPWQADFFECRYHWWPWQRPDEVLTVENLERLEEIDRQLAQLDPASDRHRMLTADRARIWRDRVSWSRILPDDSPAGDNQMVSKWPNLGFVVGNRADGTPFELRGTPAFVERETMKYDNLSMADYFHLLVNIEDYPDFVPKARELATGFLAAAVYDADPHYAPFVYTSEALDVRMDWIYDDFVAGMLDPHWLDTGDFGEQLQVGRFSDAAVIENLRQKAPFNLVDGAWLQNILSSGPCNEVQANLFAIWTDEAGSGKTELNHCNVYETLLRSVNVYLPAIRSSEFIKRDLLPSGFENPVFQMSVGLFPQDFLPELLGMTLYLEWEATPTLTPTVRMLEGRKIDPHFYRLHVAIDNIASGHGALAKQAVKLYLDDAAEKGGDLAVQAQWARIWNGYVTWATTGSFGNDLLVHLLLFDGKLPDQRKTFAEQQMVSMIGRKASAARRSHGRARLGGRPLNELFDDPATLMDLLLNDPEGWMDRENPRDSRFLRELISFTGPMFKVFTEQDVEIILDWLESMKEAPLPPDPTLDIGQEMKGVLAKYAVRGAQQPRHRAFTFPQEDGSPKAVAAWFEGPPEDMMAAMARSEYVKPGSVADSTFFTDVIGPVGMMGGILDPADEAVIEKWVAQGCPPPGQGLRSGVALQRALRAPEPLPAPFATRRLTIGHGSVH